MDLGVAVLALALVDCSPTAPPATPPPRPVPLGQEFVLGPGQAARVEGVEIRFDRVKDDSRCPVDVTCVWAGDATVVVSARRGAEARELELHATMSPRDVTYEGFKIALVKLLPVRRSTQNVTPADYRATLSVSRASSTPSPSPSAAP
jgi:hypothetical protein